MQMKKTHPGLWAGLLGLAALILGGCSERGDRPDLATYFPVKEGLKWEYQVTKTEDLKGLGEEGVDETFTYVVTNLGPRMLKDRQVFPKKGEIVGGTRTMIGFFVADKESVYEFAEQTEKDPEPRLFDFPQFYLKAPLSAGASWEVRTSSDLDDEVQVTLTAIIDSANDTVTVPAGSFAGSIKVKATGSATTTIKEKTGEAQDEAETETEVLITMEEISWYAPGVGLVRNMAREVWQRKADETPLATRAVVMQLNKVTK